VGTYDSSSVPTTAYLTAAGGAAFADNVSVANGKKFLVTNGRTRYLPLPTPTPTGYGSSAGDAYMATDGYAYITYKAAATTTAKATTRSYLPADLTGTSFTVKCWVNSPGGTDATTTFGVEVYIINTDGSVTTITPSDVSNSVGNGRVLFSWSISDSNVAGGKIVAVTFVKKNVTTYDKRLHEAWIEYTAEH